MKSFNSLKELLIQIIWYLCGLLFPIIKASWANQVIKQQHPQCAQRPQVADFQNELQSNYINKWIERLDANSIGASAIEAVYNQEAARRSSISSKAQASLGFSALIISIFSLLVPLIIKNNTLSILFPIWCIAIVAFYMLGAMVSAFYALKLEKYLFVELGEIESIYEGKLNSKSEHSGSSVSIDKEIAAYKAAALKYNQPVTLLVTNFVEASFMSLYRAIIALLLLPVLNFILSLIFYFFQSQTIVC